MGLFELLSRTREFGADVIAVNRLLKEIFQDLDSLVIEIDRSNGVVRQYEQQKFKSIGRKVSEMLAHANNMGTKFSSLSVQFGPHKMLFSGAVMMIMQITNDVENETGYSFGIIYN